MDGRQRHLLRLRHEERRCTKTNAGAARETNATTNTTHRTRTRVSDHQSKTQENIIPCSTTTARIRDTNLFDVELRTRRHGRRNMPANIRGFLKGIKPSPPVEANDRLKPSNMDRPHCKLAGNSSQPLPSLRRTTLQHLLTTNESYNQQHNNESSTQRLSVCKFQSH